MGCTLGSYQRKTTYRRFWEKVVNGPDGCWDWTGYLNKTNHYGHFRVGETQILAHRFAYQDMVGPLVPGLTIDHLCRRRHCVNPAHLEQVTYRENVMRGMTPAANNARKTHCINGHELDEKNTYVQIDPNGGPHRYCRICAKLRTRKWRTARNQIGISPNREE